MKIYGSAHWGLATFESNFGLINNYINPLIGNELVQHMTPKFVDEYYIRLQNTKSVIVRNRKSKSEYLTTGVINSIHKLLRCAFGQTVKWEIIIRNPFINSNKLKTNYRKRDIWTADIIRIFPAIMSNARTNLVLKKPKTASSIRKVLIPKTVAYILRA